MKVKFGKQNPQEDSMASFIAFLIDHLNFHAWRNFCWKFYSPKINAE